ncbi:MAG: hypothetical protein HN352_07810 [Bacteroidetes bacterium]|jgi:hypothetical protein|nr:hypothetical protein [Bacteroidota bacterium]MBT3750700.1 hypothetical protein [Bacteroidota bacterium]MBT4398830.1 hypothetical protein [Bacteroidota bacterium]MBT4408444.1 hypothetical protein [Bacteroidota bacterium]MBT5428235.1 hypothetical protein [Bacteroidota bacterium]
MKRLNYLLAILFVAYLFTSCKPDEVPDAGSSTTDLLVKKFTEAPVMDATIEDMWAGAQKLVGSTTVPQLNARGTHLNGDGEGVEEALGLFDPYSGESYDFTMRAGYSGSDIYFLLEWEDEADSKDRQSWYFDTDDKLWKGEHKYANHIDDKFYEDKFAFLFPIGEVEGFSSSTCYATCHTSTPVVNAKDKHTRHYLNNEDEKIDMWHWKRVRGTYLGQVDDQKMLYADPSKGSAANGRTGDGTGEGGYSSNGQTLTITGTAIEVSVPLYIIPNQTDYYWIDQDQIDNGTAKMITAVDENGVLSYDGGTINPADGGYEQGIGNKRFPSVTTKAFTLGRADISISANYTGTGWVCEFTRKLNTGDEDDVIFDVTQELPFGFAIFNNAAIAHGVKAGLMMKFEE